VTADLTAGWTLAIDLGETRAVGAMRTEDGTELVTVDGATSMSAGVYLDPAVGLLVGAEAAARAAATPGSFEPSPRRRLQDETVSLGGFDLPASELAAAVLERIHDEACRVRGTPPAKVRLTYPAGWANSPKLGALGLAAVTAGIENVRFAPEPVAAAQHVADTVGLAVGARLAILDVSAGTLDCAVLENTWWGLVLVGTPGGLEPFSTSSDPAAAAHELAATVERAGLTPDQLAGVHLTGDAATMPALAEAIESVLQVAPTPAADPAAAVALGAARADDDVFTTIGSLSKATRAAAMARNKAAGSAVIASGAMARAAVGEEEPEGDIWWRDQGLVITLVLIGCGFFFALVSYVIGG
jgi:molecular chaperone DnaK (HSP70)